MVSKEVFQEEDPIRDIFEPEEYEVDEDELFDGLESMAE